MLDKGKEVEIGNDSGVTCCKKSTLQQYFVRHCLCVRKEQAVRSWAVGKNHSLTLGEDKKPKSVVARGWNKVGKLFDGG